MIRSLLALLAVGVGIWLLKRQQQKRRTFVELWRDGNYMQQIAALKTDKPLTLPAIRPLTARKIWRLRETRKRA